MKGERSFLTYLTRNFFVLFLLSFFILLIWAYISTDKAVQQQQSLSIELNNRNSARVLDDTLQSLYDALQQTATRLSSLTDTSYDPDSGNLSQVIQSIGKATSFDLLRLIDAGGEQIATLDSPFYEINSIDLHSFMDWDQYQDHILLLPAKNERETLWLLVGAERIIQERSGRVMGVVIGGIVLNNDTPLAREFVLRSDAEYAILQVGENLLCSSSPLPLSLQTTIQGMQTSLARTSIKVAGTKQPIVISRHPYPLTNKNALFIVHVYQDRLQLQLQNTFLLSVAVLFLATLFLFLLFYPMVRQQVAQAMKNLLFFTEQAADSEVQPTYSLGPFSEFNRIGEAVEQMVVQLEISREAVVNEHTLLVSLMDSIPDMIFYKDKASVYLGCNRAFEELVGKPEEEIIGRTDFELFPAKSAEFFQTMDQTMLCSERPRRNEEWVTYPDGHRILLDTMETPFFDPDGKIQGLIGVGRDITRLKEIEENLAEQRERLQVTLRSIGDGVITTDTEGKVVFLNKVAEEMTGWLNAEAQGRPSTEVLHIVDEKTGTKCPSPVQRVLETGQMMGLANHTVLIARDGNRLFIADSGAPIRDRESKVIGAVIVFRDITLEKRMEEDLLNIKKLQSIGVLAGGIAHDFNNILAVILGNIELAAQCVGDKDEKVVALLVKAQKATDRATKLTKQLLTFSKGGEPVRKTTSLPDLIRESAEFVLHGSSIVPEYSFSENLWSVDVDSGQISQVIQNIITNAKQAMPKGGRVKVRCANVDDPAAETLLNAEQGHFVRIDIEDAGVGIPLELIEKIFDPYFTTKQQGNGLGLAICHSIVRKHDGYIAVQSLPGKGTTLTLYLPAAYSLGDTTEPAQESNSLIGKVKVMVMDDEEMLREMMGSQLEILGHEAILVEHGEEAIRRYKELQDTQQAVDVVIMDLTIPGGMGGQETAVRILEIDPHARLIVASGYSTDPVLAQYQQYGFRAAIEKPVNLVGLSKALEKALR